MTGDLTGFVPGLCNPILSRNVMLPQQEIQLRRMFLNVPHTVKLHLQETGFDPVKTTALVRFLIR